jgi:hypothetical protein
MCPACIATLTLAVAGTGSAGGLTALVVSKVRRKTWSRESAPARTPASPASIPPASDSKEQP